jgi:hypothetical protein
MDDLNENFYFCNYFMGMLKMEMKDFEKAINYFEESEKWVQKNTEK